MSRDIAPFGVRMPADLKLRLEHHSKENKRSLNAEIVSRLESTLIEECALLLTAEQAREQLKLALANRQEVIKAFIFESVTAQVKRGLSKLYIDLSSLDLSDTMEDDFNALIQPSMKTLAELGYKAEIAPGGDLIITF